MNALVLQPVIPLRAEASDRSEMVSQLLFGETCEVLLQQEKWSRVRCCYDGYEGWADNKQLHPLSDHEALQVEQWPIIVQQPFVTISLTSPSLLPGETCLAPITIPMGSRLPAAHRTTIAALTIEHSIPLPESSPIITFGRAYELLNAPYLWGGKTLMGIDCSGLTQTLFKTYGIRLPRDASQQQQQGSPVSLEESRRGDLLFFSNPQGRVTHVGIKFGPASVIHASGRVRIDSIDSEGIYNHEEQRYTHHLHSIRRIL